MKASTESVLATLINDDIVLTTLSENKKCKNQFEPKNAFFVKNPDCSKKRSETGNEYVQQQLKQAKLRRNGDWRLCAIRKIQKSERRNCNSFKTGSMQFFFIATEDNYILQGSLLNQLVDFG